MTTPPTIGQSLGLTLDLAPVALMPPLPDAEYIAHALGLPSDAVHAGGGKSAWQQALTSPEGTQPTLCNKWIWLPLGREPDASGGRYFMHAGTGKVWDAIAGGWCGSGWVPEKNTPRISCIWRQRHVTWSQLGQIVALTADPPVPPLAPANIKWALALHPTHARALQEYEAVHGPGTGCFDVSSLRWCRLGKPAREAKVYPYTPLPKYTLHTGAT
jgi:hypothetical protein